MGRRKKQKGPNLQPHSTDDRGAHTAAPPSNSIDKLSLNKHFAQRYEASKRKQILASAPAALLHSADDSDQSSSSSEEEDEFGELLTKGIDRRVRETLDAIRNKDPKIYDKSTRFFEDGDEKEEDLEEGSEGEDKEGARSEDEPVAGWDAIERAANSEVKKLTVKDYVRQTLLRDGKLSDSEDEEGEHGEGIEDESSGSEGEGEVAEQEGSVKKKKGDSGRLAVKVIASGLGELGDADDESDDADDDSEDDSGDDFFRKKTKTAEEIEEEEHDFERFLRKQSKKNSGRAGEDLLLHSYLANEKPDEKERFLRDFVLNNGWLDKNASEAPRVDEYEIEVDTVDPDANDSGEDGDEERAEKEEEFEEKADQFEAKYNFRFEDPEGTQIVSHGRQIADSMRRPDDRRKRAREARRLRKQKEKLAKIEDIKRLKSLKRNEIQARLLAIQEAAGEGVDLSGIDLDGDFDPDEFNRQMENKFGDDYYATKDVEMKEVTEEGLATASERRVEGKRTEKAPEDIREDVSKLVDEYYDLNYEDIVGGMPVRFKYKKVEAESFNMTAEDILDLEDRDLNRLVSMKYLAPYRSVRDTKKHSWRVREKLKNMKQAKNVDEDGKGNRGSGIQALVRAEEQAEEEIGGSSNRKRPEKKERRAKKRKRTQEQGDGGRGEKETIGHGKGSDDAQERDRTKSGDADSQGRSEPEKAKDSASRRKRKKKKALHSEAINGLSAKRREAYGIN